MSQDKWQLIKLLDLSTVKKKFKEKKSWFWNIRKDVNKIELQYRQFLYVIAVNPGKIVVPFNDDLDEFWHQHILDTAKYEKDCMFVFGQVIHHNPHLDVGTVKQKKAFNETKKMYKEAFKDKSKPKNKDSGDSSPGCSAGFVPIFCGAGCFSSHHSDSGSSHSDAGHSGASCGSSCGASCGGGGGCGGGGD